MAKRNLKRAVWVAAACLIAGCRDIPAVFHITRGNFYFSNNRLQEANYQYLKAANCESYRDVVLYNLGNVYFHLGETEEALKVWNSFDPGKHRTLNYRLYYNRAALLFEQGDNKGAFEDLKRALTLRPDSREAKNNLEMVLDRMTSRPLENAKGNEAESRRERELSAGSQRILDYVKRSEVFQWEQEDSQAETASKDW